MRQKFPCETFCSRSSGEISRHRLPYMSHLVLLMLAASFAFKRFFRSLLSSSPSNFRQISHKLWLHYICLGNDFTNLAMDDVNIINNVDIYLYTAALLLLYLFTRGTFENFSLASLTEIPGEIVRQFGNIIYQWPVYCAAILLIGTVCFWHFIRSSRGMPSRQAFLSRLSPPQHLLDPNEVWAFCRDSHERPVELPCHHIFCSECIHDMSEHFKHCPLCNRTLFCRHLTYETLGRLHAAASNVNSALRIINLSTYCMMYEINSLTI